MIKGVNLKSEVVKFTMVLMSGTIIGQLVSYALMPVITHLYTPAEMAEMGLFVNIVTIGAALSTARYELALPIVKTESHAFRLYQFTRRLVLYVVLITFGVALVMAFLASTNQDRLFYLLLPAGIGFMALTSLGTNWAIRLKSFRVISASKITASISNNLIKVGLGFFRIGYIGLIIGVVAGAALGTFFYVLDFRKSKRIHQVSMSSSRNFLLAKSMSEFPRINLPHGLMDMARDLIVIFVIWNFFSQEEYGLYNHSYQMLRVPLILVGAAISQVFFQRCAEKYNNNENMLPEVMKSIKVLALLSIVPFSIVFFFGEELFAFVFGENWRMAGVYSEIMAPWFMINFISSPISNLPMVLRKQGAFFRLAILGTLLLILSFFVPVKLLGMDMKSTLWIVSLIQFVYLLLVVNRIIYYIKQSNVARNLE